MGVCGFRGVDVSMDVRVHISDFFLVFVFLMSVTSSVNPFFFFLHSSHAFQIFQAGELDIQQLEEEIEMDRDTPVVNLWWSEWCAGHRRFLLAIVLSVGDLPFTAISRVNHNPNSTGISKSIRLKP